MKLLRVLFLVALVSTAILTIARAENIPPEYPFGLKWGMTVEEVKPLCGKLISIMTRERPTYGKDTTKKLTSVMVKNLKKTIGIGKSEFVHFIFDSEHGLEEINWRGAPTGNYRFKEAKEKYNKLLYILTNTYGEAPAVKRFSGYDSFDDKNKLFDCSPKIGTLCGGVDNIWADKKYGVAVVSLSTHKGGILYISLHYNSLESPVAEHLLREVERSKTKRKNRDNGDQ
ncbi:MAG: hypothetical protein KAS13_00695 [Candidatus Omnitrophica bacterium]|nr:hypothetical protein [Candidatus Omnitrophota bacterium]